MDDVNPETDVNESYHEAFELHIRLFRSLLKKEIRSRMGWIKNPTSDDVHKAYNRLTKPKLKLTSKIIELMGVTVFGIGLSGISVANNVNFAILIAVAGLLLAIIGWQNQ